MGFVDADKNYLDGGKTYKVTLPKGIPAAAFWSFTLYDNQSRSMLDTPQRYPRAGSQSYPSPAAEADAGLLAPSGHGQRHLTRPLLGVKQTFLATVQLMPVYEYTP
jgi:hypothetical protein